MRAVMCNQDEQRVDSKLEMEVNKCIQSTGKRQHSRFFSLVK